MKVHIVMNHDTVDSVFKSNKRAEKKADELQFGYVISMKVL